MAAPLVLLAFLAGFPSASFATSYSIPLPSFAGPVDFGAHLPLETSFDFGQRFAEIERVSIEIKGHVFAREFDYCVWLTPRPACVEGNVRLPAFFLQIDDEDDTTLGVLYTGVVIYDGRVNEARGVGVGEFTASYFFDWNTLAQGTGRIRLWPGALVFPPIFYFENYQEASGKIYGARLRIEGTPVPEPSTALLLMMGMAALSRTRQRRPRTEAT